MAIAKTIAMATWQHGNMATWVWRHCNDNVTMSTWQWQHGNVKLAMATWQRQHSKGMLSLS
jgi:hypothetical protein